MFIFKVHTYIHCTTTHPYMCECVCTHICLNTRTRAHAHAHTPTITVVIFPLAGLSLPEMSTRLLCRLWCVHPWISTLLSWVCLLQSHAACIVMTTVLPWSIVKTYHVYRISLSAGRNATNVQTRPSQKKRLVLWGVILKYIMNNMCCFI